MPKCGDCIHSEICASHLKAVRGIYGAVMSISGREVNHLESALSEISITIGQICCDDCDHFHDSSRFVELPIKPGEKIFYYDTAGHIYESTVTQLVYGATGFLIDSDVMFNSNLIGERFFFTRESAEQSLKERDSYAGRNDI